MKLALTTLVVALASAATAFGASSINGTYVTTINGATPAALDGHWAVTFNNGHYAVSKGGVPVVTGTDAVSGHTLTVRDTAGPAKCVAPNQTGVYSFSLSGSTLTLKATHDGCAGRLAILSRAPLKRS